MSSKKKWPELNTSSQLLGVGRCERQVADYWLAQLKQSHLALLEQMIVENEGRELGTLVGEVRGNHNEKMRTTAYRRGFNSALDLINTDLRAKIEELKKLQP